VRNVLIAMFTTLGLSLPAAAGTLTLSFTGNLRTDATFKGCGQGCTLQPSDDDGTWAQFAAVVENFNVTSTSSMTAISFSYGGGTNGQGANIAQGGFEPYLSLFDASGNFLGSTVAGTYCPAGSNLYQGQCFDVLLAGGTLTPGNYQIAISDWANASLAENNGPPAILSDGFTGLGNLATGEDLHFGFDVILSNSINNTPEPATFGLIGLALGVLGRLRRPR
jgi:hypothetical protein